MLNYQLIGCEDQQNQQKPWVILLHGLFGMSDNLLTFGKVLAEEFRVLLPDLINHGRSPHRKKMGYPDMAEDVYSLMDNLDISSANIIGHSMGGKVAMQMATLSPSRVLKLIVVDIAPVAYAPRHNGIFYAMKLVAAAGINSRKEADAILCENVPEDYVRQFLLKNLARQDSGLWQWRIGLAEILEAYPDIIAAPDFRDTYNGNVLIIKGETSDYILPEHAESIEKWFPNAELKVVAGAGHWLHSEKPQVFQALVRRFLG